MATTTATATTAAGEAVNVTIQKYPEWYAVANTFMMALLIIFFIVILSFALLKRQNVPITQAIEVDSREPHSITITFIPAQVMDKQMNLVIPDNSSESTNGSTQNHEDAPVAAPTA